MSHISANMPAVLIGSLRSLRTPACGLNSYVTAQTDVNDLGHRGLRFASGLLLYPRDLEDWKSAVHAQCHWFQGYLVGDPSNQT